MDQNSGGNVTYVGRAFGQRMTFYAYTLVGVPLVNHMKGLQLKSDYKVLTGMSSHFEHYDVRFWHLADISLVRCTCLLLTQSGHLSRTSSLQA